MRYLTLRHTPVTSLIGTLSLAASLFLAVVAAPAGATPPAQLSSQEKVNFEIAIKSDEELTTTITITSPASREKNLKEDCVQETFSQAATPPDITFTNDNGTPTCKATFTTPISRNNYVSHDGDEYVVDTHDDSAPKDGSADTFSLTVIFPGKVTESGGERSREINRTRYRSPPSTVTRPAARTPPRRRLSPARHLHPVRRPHPARHPHPVRRPPPVRRPRLSRRMRRQA